MYLKYSSCIQEDSDFENFEELPSSSSEDREKDSLGPSSPAAMDTKV